MPEITEERKTTFGKNPGLRKAAILMVAIGEESASEVLRNLGQPDVESITREISALKNVPADMIKEVVSEYHEMWKAKDYISEGGFDYAEQVLQKAMGDKQSKMIMQKLGFIEGEYSNGFQKLEEVNIDQIVNFLVKEHPQTIALILSRIDHKKSAAVLEKLPEEMQVDIIHRVAILGEVSSDFINGVDNYLENHFQGDFGKDDGEFDGQKIVANILNMVGKNTEKNVLGGIGGIDQKMATDIKNLMFVFDDLILVEDRSIQKILKEVDAKNLSIALKGANEETREKIFSNMSQRAGSMLKEEIEFLGPIRVKDVEEAQQSILSIVTELEERGEIVIMREGSENEVIA